MVGVRSTFPAAARKLPNVAVRRSIPASSVRAPPMQCVYMCANIFNWSIVDLQDSPGLRNTTWWLNFCGLYCYKLLPGDGYHSLLSAVHACGLSVSLCVCSSWHLLGPYPLFVPLPFPLPFGNRRVVFRVCETVPVFHMYSLVLYYCINDITQYLSFSVGFVSPSSIFSRPIHVAVNGRILFFIMAE